MKLTMFISIIAFQDNIQFLSRIIFNFYPGLLHTLYVHVPIQGMYQYIDAVRTIQYRI